MITFNPSGGIWDSTYRCSVKTCFKIWIRFVIMPKISTRIDLNFRLFNKNIEPNRAYIMMKENEDNFYISACVYVFVYLCFLVVIIIATCVCEREREREREK